MATQQFKKGETPKSDFPLMYGKVPPQSPEFEEAVLAVALLEMDALETVFEIIQDPEVFYADNHQRIFSAIKKLYDSGSKVDLLTVAERLRKDGDLEAIGGPHALAKMTDAVTSSAHVEEHARIVVEKHLARELIRIGNEAIQNGYNPAVDVFKAMETAEVKMYQLSSVGVKKKVKRIAQVVNETAKTMLSIIDRNVDFTGINTGFPSLNKCTGGWQKTDLIILAARPSVGKSALTVNLALNAAMDTVYGGGVAIFSLEMSAEQICQRMTSAMSRVYFDKIKNPKKMDAIDNEAYQRASRKLAELPIFIDDTAGLTSMELRTKVRKLVSQDDVRIVFVDYLQLMESDGNSRNGNREQEISKISRELKKLAKDCNIPIIALSQMSRGVDTQNREPQLSDLRESGAIEQDADIVMFLYRPGEKTIEQKPHLKGAILGTIKKNRNGALEEVIFSANNQIQHWTEYTNNYFTEDGRHMIQVETAKQDDLPF